MSKLLVSPEDRVQNSLRVGTACYQKVRRCNLDPGPSRVLRACVNGGFPKFGVPFKRIKGGYRVI